MPGKWKALSDCPHNRRHQPVPLECQGKEKKNKWAFHPVFLSSSTESRIGGIELLGTGCLLWLLAPSEAFAAACGCCRMGWLCQKNVNNNKNLCLWFLLVILYYWNTVGGTNGISVPFFFCFLLLEKLAILCVKQKKRSRRLSSPTGSMIFWRKCQSNEAILCSECYRLAEKSKVYPLLRDIEWIAGEEGMAQEMKGMKFGYYIRWRPNAEAEW